MKRFTASDLVACEWWPSLVQGIEGAFETHAPPTGDPMTPSGEWLEEGSLTRELLELVPKLYIAAMEMAPQHGDLYAMLARHVGESKALRGGGQGFSLGGEGGEGGCLWVKARLLHLFMIQIHEWVAFHDEVTPLLLCIYCVFTMYLLCIYC